MAKSHGSKRGITTTTATRSVLGPSLSSLVLQSPKPSIYDFELEDAASALLEETMQEVQDRRRYDPDRPRVAKKASGLAASVRALHHAPLQAIGFKDPRHVLICVRRKTRRQVLHALKRTRKGSRGAKRRNYYSNVRC